MKRSEGGFSVIEVVLVLVFLGLLSAGGYVAFHRQAKSDSPTSTKTSAGSTAALDNLATDDEHGEADIDTTYSNQDDTAVQSADNAANSIGGAYDESSL